MWLSPDGRDASSHKIIQSGVIEFFSKLKMAVAAILDLLKGHVGPPMMARLWCVLPVKNSS